jgi:NADH-ubiquinone oxidoreductase chain 2
MGFSSCLILLGSGLIYTYTGLTNLESIYSLISVSNNNVISHGFTLGLMLIFIGFLFKIASAPFHNWAPDVYNNSPTIITTWLTIIPKLSILILLLEIQIGIGIALYQFINSTENLFNYNSNFQFSILELTTNILNNNNYISALSEIETRIEINTIKILTNFILICSLFSLLIGTIVGTSQIYIKRLLAFSTISHIGFLLLALAVNTQQSIESFLFYLIQYSLTSLNIFLIVLALGYKHYLNTFSLNKFKYTIDNNENINNINFNLTQPETGQGDNQINYDLNYIIELKGLFNSNPLLSISLAISLFSFAGIPPLLGFFAKQQILYASINNGYFFLSIIAILTSVISAFYYIRIIRILHSDSSNLDNKIILIDSLISNTHSFLIGTLTLIILLFIFYPVLILNSLKILTLSIFI